MIFYSHQAEKFIEKAEQTLAQRLLDRIGRLEQEPFPQDCKSIKGESGMFRIRVGDLRIIYRCLGTLFILRIDKRETVY